MELLIGKRWLYATLNGDATLLAAAPGGVWDRMVGPEAIGQKYVILLPMSDPTYAAGVGPARIWSEMLILVKAAYQGGDPEELEAIVNRADALLHGQKNIAVSGGGTIVACTALRSHERTYTEQGKPYWELGTVYRLLVRP